jgi:hypothetical protein
MFKRQNRTIRTLLGEREMTPTKIYLNDFYLLVESVVDDDDDVMCSPENGKHLQQVILIEFFN